MDSGDSIRPKKEIRRSMELATSLVSTASDEHGGELRFWKVPLLSFNRENLCSSQVGPVIAKRELHVLPTLEHVDVSTSMREKKNLLDPSQKVPAWKHSPYLKKRKQEVANYEAILRPSASGSTDFISRERGFSSAEEYVTYVPVISIMDMSSSDGNFQDNIRDSPVREDILATLKIQNLEVKSNAQYSSESRKNVPKEITWTLNFVCQANEKSEQYLHLENTGTVAITYQWRNATSTPNVLPMRSKNLASFFFNKNKALILPGQKVKFAILFQQRQVGIFSESWRINTTPIVSKADLIIHMCGYTALRGSDTSQLEIDVYLDRCIRNTVIREMTDGMISNERLSEALEPAYKSLYLERRLFRAKNRFHYYNASLVAHLRRLYTTASPSDLTPWMLSLIDLRHVLLRNKNTELKHETLKVFSDVCQQCLRICLFHSIPCSKYAMVYTVLCVFANRMDEEGVLVKRHCVPRNEDSDTITEISIRSPRNSSVAILGVELPASILDHTANAVYREVFYLRTYELLMEAVEQACAIIDSLDNLNELEL